MAKGYAIFTEDIHDPEGITAYMRAAGPSGAEFGLRPLVVSDDVEVIEGEWHGTRTVVLEFDSVEQARAWYESDAYSAAKPLRLAAADCNGVIVAGFDMPGA